MKTLADTDIQAFALIHWLGVEVVQQVVRVAVAVSAHHHQGNEGGQENGGQHPNGHDHHRLHGDSGSHGGCRQQLVSWQKTKKKESNQGRLIVRARLFMGAHLSRGEESMVSVWLGDNKPEKSDIIVTLEDVSSRNLKMKRHALLSQQGKRIQSEAFCLFVNVAHLHAHIQNWSLSEHIRRWSALCLHFVGRNENRVFAVQRLFAKLGATTTNKHHINSIKRSHKVSNFKNCVNITCFDSLWLAAIYTHTSKPTV